VGRYLIALDPERAEDFTDWASIYFPQQAVTLIAAVPHDGKVHFTFDVTKPDVVVWWANIFGLPSNLTDAPRVVAPSVDRVQRAIEKPIEAVRTAADATAAAVTSLGPLITVGLLLLLYLETTKGRRHELF
jgi:hypothetical protein